MLTRRAMHATAASAAFAIGRSRPGFAAEFNYRFGLQLPSSHPIALRTDQAAGRILEQSGGRLQIRVFPNGQLGADMDMMSQVRSGALQVFALSPIVVSTLVPKAAINGMPFAFKNYDQVWKAMDGELGAAVRAEIGKAGLVAFEGVFDNGYRVVTNSVRPINTPQDLRNMKVRVPVSPLWLAMFKAFGASPVSMGFSELYSALQTHIVDGQENPLPLIDASKIYEVQSFCSLTNHMWDGFWILWNQAAWRKLPDDLKEIVSRNFHEAVRAERKDIIEQNATVQDRLARKGLAFNTPDRDAFKQILVEAGFYKDWKEKMGPDMWSKLEAAVGPLS